MNPRLLHFSIFGKPSTTTDTKNNADALTMTNQDIKYTVPTDVQLLLGVVVRGRCWTGRFAKNANDSF